MERLTIRLGDGSVIAWHPLKYYDYNDFKRVLERLADYEDSGLTPEQVTAMVEKQKGQAAKRYRPVVRVDDKTGEVVRFPSVKSASNSIGRTNISMSLLTNRPLKGYRFYYEEDWKGGVDHEV